MKTQRKSLALLLGTAMWGWTVPKSRCFELLDAYYALGGRIVDGATNYPINKQPVDFHKAADWLAEWITVNGINDLEVMMKVGSVNNLRTPEHNLSPSFLLLSADKYRNLYGSNLRTLMIHWDNRDDQAKITESLEALAEVTATGLTIGLSGIKHPEVYRDVLTTYDFGRMPLQLKHNVVYSDAERYQPLLAGDCYGIAYGINAGGIKLSADAYRKDASLVARGGEAEKHEEIVGKLQNLLAKWRREKDKPTLHSMNHLGLLYAAYHPVVEGVLLGTSRVEQLEDSWQWAERLHQFDYALEYQSLANISATAN